MSGFGGSGSSRQAADSTEHYDDAAFGYFVISLLILILVPWTYSYAKKLRSFSLATLAGRSSTFQRKQEHSSTISAGALATDRASALRAGGCPCAGCIRKRRLLQVKSSTISTGGVIKLVVFLLLWALTVLLVWQVWSADAGDSAAMEAAAFDPYAILGIPESASEQEIKKAYRRLSRDVHPDKNPDDKDAAAKYDRITDAKNSLLDPKTRENFEKYGNPDGPQAVSVGIALPSWLVDQNNSLAVLGGYVALLCVLFPSVALLYWRKQKNKALGEGVLVNTVELWKQAIARTEVWRTTKLLEIMCSASEFKDNLAVRRSDEAELKRIEKALPEENTTQKKTLFNADYIKKATTLLQAHISRETDTLPELLQQDMAFILSQTEKLSNGLIETVTQLALQYEGTRRKDGISFVGMLTPLLEIVALKQMITQCVWTKESKREASILWQIPHLRTIDFELQRALTSREWKPKLAHAGYSLNQVPAVASQTDINAADGTRETQENGVVNGVSNGFGIGQTKPKSLEVQFVEALEELTKDTSVNMTSKQRAQLIKDNHPKVVSSQPPSIIRQFCLLSASDRKTLLSKMLTDDQISDVEAVIARLPFDVTFKPTMPPYTVVSHEGERDDWHLTPGSVATLVVTIGRPSLPGGADASKLRRSSRNKSEEEPIPAHCPLYPVDRDEGWWVFFGQENGQIKRLFAAPQRIIAARDGTEVRIKFPVPNSPGTMDCRIWLVSDTYAGFDSLRTVRMQIHPAPEPISKTGAVKGSRTAAGDDEFEGPKSVALYSSDSDSDSDSDSESEEDAEDKETSDSDSDSD